MKPDELAGNPSEWGEHIENNTTNPPDNDRAHNGVDTFVYQETNDTKTSSVDSSEEMLYKRPNEVIKASKVHLPGLKIVGKIDISEVRDSIQEKEIQRSTAKKRHRNDEDKKKWETSRHLDLIRRQHGASTLKKKKTERFEEKKRDKERRTNNYFEKMKHPVLHPRVTRKEKENEYEVFVEESSQQSSHWITRFFTWFVAR